MLQALASSAGLSYQLGVDIMSAMGKADFTRVRVVLLNV